MGLSLAQRRIYSVFQRLQSGYSYGNNTKPLYLEGESLKIWNESRKPVARFIKEGILARKIAQTHSVYFD